MSNPTIGHITCPIVGDTAEVRRDKKQKLYYVGLAGMVKPNLPAGQEYMKLNTNFIGENGTPLPPPKTVNENETVNENKQPEKSGGLMSWLEASDDE